MENAETQITILSKNELYSLLSLVSGFLLTDEGTMTAVSAVAKLDPREEQPLVKPFDSKSEARAQYRQAIETSLARGWQIDFQGSPLYG